MKIKFIVAVFICLGALAEAWAAARTQDALRQKNVFGIIFGSDSSVYVNAASVSSISKEEYILGTLFVSEIVIDTNGNSQIRIYNSSPLDPTKIKEKARKMLPTKLQSATEIASYAEKAKGKIEETAGISLSGVSTVYKEYPATTHSKTIEFAVSDPDELNELYELLIADFTGSAVQKNEKNKKNSEQASSGENSTQPAKLGGSIYTLEE